MAASINLSVECLIGIYISQSYNIYRSNLEFSVITKIGIK